MTSESFRASISIGNDVKNQVVNAVFHPGLTITGKNFHDNLQDDRGYLPIQSCLDLVADIIRPGFASSGEYENTFKPFSEGAGDIEFFMYDNLPTIDPAKCCDTPWGKVWFRIHATARTDEGESDVEEGILDTIFVFDASTDCP